MPSPAQRAEPDKPLQPMQAGGPHDRLPAFGGPLTQAWADLSLRAKLLLFALGLVTVPGVLFAVFAFVGARAALEREIGIRLRQSAERGAEAVTAAVQRAQADARSWARQDLMRDLTVGDVDLRVSRFLQTVRGTSSPYLVVLCVDPHDRVIAASGGEWVGRQLQPLLGAGGERLLGPLAVPELGPQVLVIAAPIDSPDPPNGGIGRLILLYDWDATRQLLDAIRAALNGVDKRVAAFVVDRAGAVIGGVSFDGSTPEASTVVAATGGALPVDGYGVGSVRGARGAQPVLLGAAPVGLPQLGWSVLVIERAGEALAAVDRVRNRWIALLGGLLLASLAVATLLARQVLRPLSEVTAAIGELAAHPDRPTAPLPVRSRNEVGRLAESFNRMTSALRRSREEALSAAKFAFAGQLAAMVAHEVRTPLAVMRSSAQLLADPAAPAAQQAELAETIVAEVDRIERVVSELIQLARPLEPHVEPTSLEELLARAADFVAAQARRQQIDLQREFSAQPPAHGDREQIYQVMLNLIVNALQALPPGGQLTLRSLPPHAGSVGFEVADDGPGLPAAIRDRIFEPFVSGRADGTGLGLAFVDRIVRAHRGSVTVRSQAGGGTVFAVRLPMAEGQA